MKDKFLINFYRDGVIVSQQRFSADVPGPRGWHSILLI